MSAEMAAIAELPALQRASYEELCGATLRAVREGGADALGRALSQLERVALDDLDEIVAALDELDGLSRDLADHDGQLATLARSFIPGAMAVLEAASARLRLAEDRKRRHDRADAVADRVRRALVTADQPLRSSDLADALELDLSQVSRALRLLKDRGLVVDAPAPRDSTDGRARWHRAAAAHDLAA